MLAIADFTHVGKIATSPWHGNQYIALQSLTRCRFHLVENISREKSYILSNIFLKFSELAVTNKTDNPFSDTFGASTLSKLTDFLSIKVKIDFLILRLLLKFFKKAARDSYQLHKALDKAITKTVTGLCSNEFDCALSISGVGSIFAADNY